MSNTEQPIQLFEKDRIGRLMRIQDDPFTRFQFEIWFEYTRQSMVHLKEGTFLAAKNFASNDDTSHYSVLELTSIKPIHYALGTNPDGYPGFVMEAAKNISSDWTSQESESTEDTTIIKCIATPTEMEILEDLKERNYAADSSIPMIGIDVKVITNKITEEIINQNILKDENLVIPVGNWIVDSEIPVFLSIDDFLRVHFGIFGFTKAGKSNLLSTLIAKILSEAEQKEVPIKIVIFDLMSEYNVLLLDLLDKMENGRLIARGERTLPGSMIDFFTKPNSSIDTAINDFTKSSLFPQELQGLKGKIGPVIKKLIENNKIRVWSPPQIVMSDFISECRSILLKSNVGNCRRDLHTFITNIQSRGAVNLDLLNDINNAVDQLLNGQTNHPLLNNITFPANGFTATANTNLRDFQITIGRKIYELARLGQYRTGSTIITQEMINDLNNISKSSLYIIQSHDPDELRNFAFEFGNDLFENRRRNGIIEPVVSFIFDEADEFIPRDAPSSSSYENSVNIVHMLARRGRKFGIGIGIATQRTRYLNTSIMAQPHTYLVGKLPRRADREVVQDAFGFSEEVFNQTFKFGKGDWLLASYDATGLTGVPIPIHAENANERIKKALSAK